MSLPVRWGDKCMNAHQKKISGGAVAEMDCFTVGEHMQMARFVQATVEPHLKYLIVTSESPAVMGTIQETYASNQTGFPFIFVTNANDSLQGVGSLVSGPRSGTGTGSGTNSSVLEVMVSQLAAVQLQMNARFYLYAIKTNWLRGIYALKHWLPCDGSPLLDFPWPIAEIDTECLHMSLKDYQSKSAWPRMLFPSPNIRAAYERKFGKQKRTVHWNGLFVNWRMSCSGIPPDG